MKKPGGSSSAPVLSQRQAQILKLLQAGKVNKEVAEELDIGLGTVKQHIVALFKKLNVSNRTMAVSRGMSIQQEREHPPSAMKVDGLLERRPCVVLSIALPEEADSSSVRHMHGSLAGHASVCDAVFLARKGNAGDIIFGVQQVTEYDLAIALNTMRKVYDDLLNYDVYAAKNMRGGLVVGVAVASMRRFGGWTGEAIASAAIAQARELLQHTPPGFTRLDPMVKGVLEIFGIGGLSLEGAIIANNDLNKLVWAGSRQKCPMIGRSKELARFDHALTGAVAGQGGLIHVIGEMGMGKTRLCEEFVAHSVQKGGEGHFFRCLPPLLEKNTLLHADRGVYCSSEEVAVLVSSKPDSYPAVVIIDDMHLLTKEQQLLLSAAASDAVQQGKLIVFSSRRAVRATGGCLAEEFVLRRLHGEAIETLVMDIVGESGNKGQSRKKIRDISNTAVGVPLFAVELARDADTESMSLTLQIVISARLDRLHLDRILLHAVAKCPAVTTLKEVSAYLGESSESIRQQLEATVAAGVLRWGAGEEISFAHPLLRRAIISLSME